MCPELLREIKEEVSHLLSNLIRIDTTNPPGNETKAAEYLADNLQEDGFECKLLESAPGRGNIVTRLKGTGEKPSLLLLSHLDVVAANPKEWSVDPFGGLIKDGFVWGRGALDMKGMTAIEVMVMKLLKRNNARLKGDVILAATADEERGGEAGAGWLVRNHAKEVRAEYVLNEGGGTAIPMDGKNVYTIQTAEKGILWFKIRSKGRPGHGSIPGAADNAILRMNKVVEKLGHYRPRMALIPATEQYLKTIAGASKLLRREILDLLCNLERGDQILDVLARKDEYLAEEIRARLRIAVTPTMIHGGVKENIIPSECEAVFDCRVLPGQNTAETLDTVKDLLKDVDLEKLEFEIVQTSEPSESSMQTQLYGLLVSVLKEYETDCIVTPTMLTGGTDSRFFRNVGCTCYGFQPVRADIPYGEMQKTIHGIDERISVENLIFGTSVIYDVVREFMT